MAARKDKDKDKDKDKNKDKNKDKENENTEQWPKTLGQEIDSVFEELDTINKELFDR